MRAVLQRVQRAAVRVEGRTVGAIGSGLLVLVCALRGDGPGEARRLARRVATWRCFPDREGRMNLALAEAGGALLVVSQFTLAADGRKGRRPSFDHAAPPELAEPLCAEFVRELRAQGLEVAEGRFGAAMEVELVNDGPVTFVFDEPPEEPAGGG